MIGQFCFVASSISQTRAEGPESQPKPVGDATSRPILDFLERMGIVLAAVPQSLHDHSMDRAR
jgi:hypothetical protein